MENDEPLPIVLLEDSAADITLLQHELKRNGPYFDYHLVETESGFKAALIELEPVLIISDYRIPGFDGLAALEIAKELRPGVPFIMVSGNRGEDLAVEALQSGATDYILKSNLHRLSSSIQRALSEAAKRKELKEARDNLESTTKQLKRLLAGSPTVIYSLKIEGNELIPTLVSENIQSFLGFSVSESLQKDWWLNQLHPDHIGKVASDFERLLSHGSLVREFLIRHRDGSWRWIEDHQRLLCDTQGQPLEVAGVWTDITERKKANEAIRERDFQYRQLVDLLPNALYTTDEKGKILLYNTAAVNLWGQEPDPETDRWCGSYALYETDGNPLPKDQCPIALTFKETRPIREKEMVIERPDGSRRIALPYAQPMLDAQSRLIGTVNMVLDITERKQAEEQLRLQSTALNAAANAIVITNQEGRIQWVNPAFSKLTGYSSQEVIGHNPRLLKSDLHPPEFYKDLWQTILAGKVWQGTIHNKHKTGRIYQEEMTITPLIDKNGKVSHFIAVKNDITEKLEMEQLFLRSQRMEAIGGLASGIAHDLNNALAPILMAITMLKDLARDPATKRMVESIQICAERGTAMVKQIMTFARGSAGEIGLIQVKHLVNDMAELIKQTFPRSIQVYKQYDQDVWPIKANATHIHQILLNLCVNARDAMPNGGTLNLSLSNAHLDETGRQLSPDAKPGRYVRLTVADSGCGIAPEVLKQVFKAFFTTKEPGKGTGLGLSTVQSLVQHYQGFLTVETEVDQGTQFHVYLPAQLEDVDMPEPAQPTDRPAGRGELILVVDDEASIRNILGQTLEVFGYRVLKAADGGHAISTMSQYKGTLKLILTDLDMPVMDGEKTIQAARQILPEVKVIVVTGSDIQAHQSSLKELNVDALLHKPFRASDLLKVVHLALHGDSNSNPPEQWP